MPRTYKAALTFCIELMEEEKRPMTASELADLLRLEYTLLITKEQLEGVLEMAVIDGIILRGPGMLPHPCDYLPVKRMFPESKHPMSYGKRPPASVWELGRSLFLDLEWPDAHREPHHDRKPVDKPNRDRSKERPKSPGLGYDFHASCWQGCSGGHARNA